MAVPGKNADRGNYSRRNGQPGNDKRAWHWIFPVIFTGVFAFGAFIAGCCGLLGAQSLGISLDISWDVLLLSMMVVVIGGTGSIQGALVGGLIIGLAETLGKMFFPDVAYFTMYALLIIVLIVRPSGLIGRTVIEWKNNLKQHFVRLS